MGTTIVIKTPGISTAPGLETLLRDPLLEGAGAGVRFLFDLASALSWPSQGNPVNGSPIGDVAEVANGAFLAQTGETTFAGGGFDFTAVTADPAAIVGPAGRLAGIHAGGQKFMVCLYAKLPSAADWNTAALIAPFFSTTASAGGYPGEADMLTIAQNSGGSLSFRRQLDGAGTIVNKSVAVQPGDYGQLAQIAYYRTAAGGFGLLRTAAGIQITSADASANNTGDFSQKQPRFGVVGSFNDLVNQAPHRAAANYRLFRGFVEDLALSGRDPSTVLAADWDRVQARGAFS